MSGPAAGVEDTFGGETDGIPSFRELSGYKKRWALGIRPKYEILQTVISLMKGKFREL